MSGSVYSPSRTQDFNPLSTRIAGFSLTKFRTPKPAGEAVGEAPPQTPPDIATVRLANGLAEWSNHGYGRTDHWAQQKIGVPNPTYDVLASQVVVRVDQNWDFYPDHSQAEIWAQNLT